MTFNKRTVITHNNERKFERLNELKGMYEKHRGNINSISLRKLYDEALDYFFINHQAFKK